MRQRVDLVLVNQPLTADLRAKLIAAKVNLMVDLLLLIGHRHHRVEDARNENLAAAVHQLRHQLDQVGHRLVDAAAVDARVEVLRGALHLQAEVAQAAQAVRQTGLVCAQPVVVADADKVDVLEEGVLSTEDNFVQPFGARLFHAFKDKL